MLSGEKASTAVSHRARRAEHDAARPRQQSLRELEPGVPLADDEDALALVVLGCVCRDVVRRCVEPGNRRDPRLGHADRKHADPAAVLAVRRPEHEARSSRRVVSHSQLVANANVSARANSTSAASISRASRNVVCAVHELRHERLVRALVADEAVVVVPLVLARARLERRVRLRPADQALVDRQAAEHAARRGVAREHRAARDSGAGEAVRGLQAAGPASRQRTTSYSPGGNGRASTPSQTFAARNRRASIWSIRYITLGCLSRNGFSSLSGMIRQRRRDVAITSAVGGSSVKIEISPKKSPRVRRARSRAVDHDLRLAVEDHVEAASGDVLADDALALGEDLLVERVRDRLELRVRHVGEEAQPRECVDVTRRLCPHGGEA